MARSKYINTFNTTAEYDAYIESALPEFPNVGYDKQAGKVNIVRQPHSSHLIWGATNETSDFTVRGGATFTVDTVENIFYTDTWDNTITNYNSFFMNAPIITIRKMLIDTSNAIDMGYMFMNCRTLISIDLSNFNTSNTTTIEDMFNGCKSLTSLDLSNFNTSNVSTISRMYNNCSALTSLDLSNCDFSNVSNTYNTFYNCSALTDVYITVEATLNKLTKNLTSANYNYIPSSATIHYNDVNYVWNGSAWTPQN